MTSSGLSPDSATLLRGGAGKLFSSLLPRLSLLIGILGVTASVQAQPGTLLYEGLLHESVGGATLTVDPTGSLVVSNIGSSGLDGVEIRPAGFQGGLSVTTSLDLDSLPTGSSLSARTLGSTGTGALVEVVSATLEVTAPGEFVFSGGGAGGGIIRVYFGGRLVHEEPGNSFGFASALSGTLHWRSSRSGDLARVRLSVDCGVIRHRLIGSTVIGDAVEFTRVEPCLGLPEECDVISSLRLFAAGIGSFALGEETVLTLGAGFSGTGAGSLIGGTDATGLPIISVSNIGSSGLDGVSVRYSTLVSECAVQWSSLVPDNPALPGASLTIGSRGIVAGNDTFLGSLTIADVGGSLVCTPDYSPISALSHRVEVYNAGVPVVSLPGLVTPIIEVAGLEFPSGCGKLNQWPLLCLWSDWQTAQQFTINGGAPVVGDELRVIAEGSVEVIAISEIPLSTLGISGFDITDVTGTAFLFPHRPPPLDIDIDLLTGNAILAWESSITYKDISVSVTDEDTQTVQVYPLPGTATSVDLGPLVTRGRVVTKFCLGQDTTVNPAETFSVEHRLHGGLNHFSLGEAQLTPVPDGLQVSNIGSSGLDGVSISLSDFDGVEISTICELPAMPVGSSVSFRQRSAQIYGDIVVTREVNGVRFAPADASGVPVTYTLQASLGDLLAYEATGVSGDTVVGLLLPAVQNLRYSQNGDPNPVVHTFHIEGGYVVAGFDPDPDNLCVFDRLDFIVEPSPPVTGPITHIEVRGTGVPMLMLGEVKHTPRPPVLLPPTVDGGTIALGNARVVGTVSAAGERSIRVGNIGSSGCDGIRVDLGSSSELAVEFEPIVPTPGAINATLVVGSQGAVLGETQFLGSVSIVDQGGTLSLTPDYSPIGSTSQRIEVLDQGVVVATFPGLVTPIIEVAGNVFPPRCGKLDQWPLLCLWFEWSSQRVVTVGGAVVAGDEVRVIAEGSVEVNAISALDFTALGISELAILAMTSTPYAIPPITDLAASVNPADGHVTVSWTNPIVYGSADLVIEDTVVHLGSPAPSQVEIGVPSPALTFIWLKLFFEKRCVVIVIDLPSLLSTGGDPQFIRGDANNDLSVDIGDPIFILGYLFSGGSPPSCFAAGDSNLDGDVDIGDPIFILGYLFSNGSPPAAPFPACGVGPAGGVLPCSGSACAP